MLIKKVLLNNFRNINEAEITLGPGLNIFYGDNAQGKTNFLESVYFCAMGRSHRLGRDRDLVMIGEKSAYTKVFLQNDYSESDIRLQIERDNKKIWVNGLPIKRLGDLFGNLLCVIFSPEDLMLIKGGPQVRRRFLDMELCQLYPTYYHNIRMYYKVMKQRNNLLKEISLNPKLTETLETWDEQLAKYGCLIITARKKFVKNLSNIAAANQSDITGQKEELEIIYKSNVAIESFLEKLTRAKDYDILRKTTSVGIHKDDMEFKINGKCGRIYASQGQQRTAALSVKLAQISLIEQEKDVLPVLLLDDLLSELDVSRQEYLMERTKGLQSIITLTGAESAFDTFLNQKNAKIFKVQNGKFLDEVKV